MVKFHIIFAILSIISSVGNIIVGTYYSGELYTQLDLLLAVLQVIASSLLILTGLAKLKFLVKSEMLSKLFMPSVFIFWAYIVVLITIMSNYR